MNRFFNILQKSFVASSSATLSQKYKILEISTFQGAAMIHHKTNQPTVAAGVAQTKKPKDSPKITLIAQNQAMSVTSLEEAKKLAKRRDLHLIQLEELDAKTHRPIYKLATAAEMLSQELDERAVSDKQSNADNKNSHKKSEKSLTIGSRIAEHDLASRIKNISKWLSKHHEVRIIIQGNADDMTNSETIFKTIEQSIKEPEVLGKIVQRRSKGSVIKFNIIPAVPTAAASSSPTSA